MTSCAKNVPNFALIIILCLRLTLVVHASLHVNGYLIDDSCAIDGPNPRAFELSRTLSEMQADLMINVIPDAQLGTASERGFTAFFKTDDNKDRVIKAFDQVYDGEVFSNKCFVASPQVTFHCVDPDAPDSVDARRCNRVGGPVAYFDATASNILKLCPRFFTLPVRPEIRFCPSVRRNEMTNTELASTQISFLIRELVQMYNQVPAPNRPCTDIMDPEFLVDNHEDDEVQQVAEFPAEQQVKNSYNYVLYASCKSGNRILFRQMSR